VPVDSDLPGLEELAELGLVALSEDGSELLAVDPRLASLQLVGEWRRQAWRLELRAATLERDISELSASYVEAKDERREPVRYLHGLRAITQFIDETSYGAREEILTAQPGGGRSAAVLESALPLALDQLARGIRLRTLYQHPARFSEPTKEYVREVTAHGAMVRTLDEFFDRLIIVDRSVAILPATADRSVAVAVADKAVVRFLADVFERNWQRATMFTPTRAALSSSEVVPDIHLMIRRLLKEGLTDSAIAKRIGISERTYHTHLARIRKELRADNRVQLGYMLALEDVRAGRSEPGDGGVEPALP
jgi:sugar-specific transcriptional regulator TrmB